MIKLCCPLYARAGVQLTEVEQSVEDGTVLADVVLQELIGEHSRVVGRDPMLPEG